jgi:hypothetical protein
LRMARPLRLWGIECELWGVIGGVIGVSLGIWVYMDHYGVRSIIYSTGMAGRLRLEYSGAVYDLMARLESGSVQEFRIIEESRARARPLVATRDW